MTVPLDGLFLALFGHDCEDVAVGIAEEGHPEFVIGHFGDKMGFAFEGDAAVVEGFVSCVDVQKL